MPMPAVPGSALKLIRAKLGLALFKILLYGPPQRRDFPNFFQRRVLGGVGDLILNSAVFVTIQVTILWAFLSCH
jgi:hypothetical protein